MKEMLRVKTHQNDKSLTLPTEPIFTSLDEDEVVGIARAGAT